jgi:hypothetical protein
MIPGPGRPSRFGTRARRGAEEEKRPAERREGERALLVRRPTLGVGRQVFRVAG